MTEPITVYCDGACSGNQSSVNKGGWGAIIMSGKESRRIHGGERNTSNQRMELMACIKSLESTPAGAAVNVFSDSAYLVNCFRQKWFSRWEVNGWKNATGKPVENRDLWETLLKLVRVRKVVFERVNGHSGIELNEEADELARLGVEELK
jgi:ribonuclease HI